MTKQELTSTSYDKSRITSAAFHSLILLASLVCANPAVLSADPPTWTPLPENPIIIGFPQNYNVFTAGTVIKEDGLYKVWGGTEHIQYSTSVNGITWSHPTLLPGLGAGTSESFDRTSLFGAAVIHNTSLGIYQMWYTGQRLSGFSDFRIGYATSTDGINWTKVTGPGTGGCVIDKGQLPGEGEKVGQPVVLFEESVYKMWYHGSDAGSNVGGAGGIFYAESSDGVNWTKLGKVIDRGSSGEFDYGGTYPRTILRVGAEYILWYDIDNDQSQIYKEAYATSTDGQHWNKGGLISFPAESWCLSAPPHCDPRFFHIVASGPTLEVWYFRTTGSNIGIGYATSVVCSDSDGDGYGAPGDVSCGCGCAETDCNDNNIFVFPGATEDCNGIDDNCDGAIDEGFDQDDDGFTTCGGDCDDADATVNPDGIETCNGVDDNCDGNIDEGFDQDGDGVAECFDNCPSVPNDQTDSDQDGAGDACDICPFDPDDDGDDDGVCGDVDVCANTTIPEAVPTVKLNPNHWALTDGDKVFDTVKKGNGSGRGYTTHDTGGCSCEQIIHALGLGAGHRKHGCSNSAMDDWIAQLP